MAASEEITEQLIQRLDTSTPGLFVMRLDVPLSAAAFDNMNRVMTSAIQQHCPGSTILILPRGVGIITTRRIIQDLE